MPTSNSSQQKRGTLVSNRTSKPQKGKKALMADAVNILAEHMVGEAWQMGMESDLDSEELLAEASKVAASLVKGKVCST